MMDDRDLIKSVSITLIVTGLILFLSVVGYWLYWLHWSVMVAWISLLIICVGLLIDNYKFGE